MIRWTTVDGGVTNRHITNLTDYMHYGTKDYKIILYYEE
jgi:hypothetical protein